MGIRQEVPGTKKHAGIYLTSPGETPFSSRSEHHSPRQSMYCMPAQTPRLVTYFCAKHEVALSSRKAKVGAVKTAATRKLGQAAGESGELFLASGWSPAAGDHPLRFLWCSKGFCRLYSTVLRQQQDPIPLMVLALVAPADASTMGETT